MILALTPEVLIQERVAAFMLNDFATIFHSYHPDAPFLHFFPDVNAYVAYAEAELVSTFSINAFQILRSRQQGESAEVLFSQRLLYQGEILDSLEIARCRRDGRDYWSFVAGLRLDAVKLPLEPLQCSWDVLIAAGNDLWI